MQWTVICLSLTWCFCNPIVILFPERLLSLLFGEMYLQCLDPRISYSTDGILGYVFTVVSLSRAECLILLVLCQSSLSLQVNFDQICTISCAFTLTLLEFWSLSTMSCKNMRHIIVWSYHKRDARDYTFMWTNVKYIYTYRDRIYIWIFLKDWFFLKVNFLLYYFLFAHHIIFI